MTRCGIVTAVCLLLPALAAQDGPTARTFCDPTDPRNQCPGASCICAEDVLAIRFDPGGGPIIELGAIEPGLRLGAEVVLETRSMAIQGWSYGVRHDGRALAIESATTDGTDAGNLFATGFNATRFEDILDCAAADPADPAAGCPDPKPAAGFISAVVLSLIQNVVLPPGSNSLARAAYRLEPTAAEIGEGGILIEFSEGLSLRNSPPVQITFTNNGRSLRPKALVDGRIVVSLAGKAFHRGDPDADGRLSVADAIALLLFLFLAGPAPDCLDAGDIDDDGRIDTTDPVFVLHWLFLDGTAPAPPGPPPAPCGPDPEGPGSSLGCDAYGACP